MELIIKLCLICLLFFILKRDRTVLEICQFLIRPHLAKKPLAKSAMSFIVIKLAIINGFISIIVSSVIPDSFVHDIPSYKRFLENKSLTYIFISAVIFAPIIEEIIFRYVLRKPIIFISLLLSISLFLFFPIEMLPSWLILTFVFILLPITHIIERFLFNTKKIYMLRLWITHFRSAFLLLSALFALAHFDAEDGISLYTFILFLVQFKSAIIFGWVRMKLNLRCAMATHALYNFAIVIVSIVGEYLTQMI